MKKEKLIQILKNYDLSFYTTIDKNVDNISKEQLKDIILSFCLHIPNYIISPTIQKHFYNDVIKDLEITWKRDEN